MKIKGALLFTLIGVGGTILYQEIKNGNLRNMIRKMNRKKTKMLESLEEIM